MPTSLGILALGGRGGSSRMALRSAQALARRGSRCRLLTERPWTRVEWEWGNGPAVAADTLGPSPEQGLAEAARRHRLDLVHVHYAWPAAAWCAEVLGALGVPWVATLHGSEVLDAERCRSRARDLGSALASARAVAAPSADLAHRALAVFGDHMDSRGIDVLPNFLSGAWFGRSAEPRAGPATWVHASGGRQVKRVDVLLEALALAAPRCAAGGVELALELRGDPAELAGRSRGPAGRVRLVGWRSSSPGWLAGATGVVLASDYESFGLAALEALAAGVPVLAPAVGGLVDLLDGGRAGTLVAPADPRELAEAWTRATLRPREARRRARRGRRRALARFSEDAVLPAWEAWLAAAMHGTGDAHLPRPQRDHAAVG